jgi:hypothetical protein
LAFLCLPWAAGRCAQGSRVARQPWAMSHKAFGVALVVII